MAEVVLYAFLLIGVVVAVWMVFDIIRIARTPRSSNDSDGWPSE